MRVGVQSMTQGPDGLGVNPVPAAGQLCDLGRILNISLAVSSL